MITAGELDIGDRAITFDIEGYPICFVNQGEASTTGRLRRKDQNIKGEIYEYRNPMMLRTVILIGVKTGIFPLSFRLEVHSDLCRDCENYGLDEGCRLLAPERIPGGLCNDYYPREDEFHV